MPSDFDWDGVIFGLLALAEVELEEADAAYRATLARQYVQKTHKLNFARALADSAAQEGKGE